MLRQFAPDGGHFPGLEAEAALARVELEVNRQARRRGRVANHAQLFETMHGGRQSVLEARHQVVSIKKTFQEQNRLFESGLTQGHGGFDFKQCKAVRDIGDGNDQQSVIGKR
ncbi:hypothetical protein AGMMS50256_36690 [Betaproteobacteria bacterium]|nr:hypothetical protein AGMMS50256_36690 [Betaproteobacteria bacterium]